MRRTGWLTGWLVDRPRFSSDTVLRQVKVDMKGGERRRGSSARRERRNEGAGSLSFSPSLPSSCGVRDARTHFVVNMSKYVLPRVLLSLIVHRPDRREYMWLKNLWNRVYNTVFNERVRATRQNATMRREGTWKKPLTKNPKRNLSKSLSRAVLRKLTRKTRRKREKKREKELTPRESEKCSWNFNELQLRLFTEPFISTEVQFQKLR